MTRSSQPTRRLLLRALGMSLLGIPLISLGKLIDRRERRRRRYVRPTSATSDLWIGHC